MPTLAREASIIHINHLYSLAVNKLFKHVGTLTPKLYTFKQTRHVFINKTRHEQRSSQRFLLFARLGLPQICDYLIKLVGFHFKVCGFGCCLQVRGLPTIAQSTETWSNMRLHNFASNVLILVFASCVYV